MRLLIFTQYFWPENFRVNDLVAALVARGHDVTVLTGVPNYPDGEVFGEYRAQPHAFGTYQGSEVIRVPMLPRRKGSVRLVLNYASFVLSAATFGPWRLRGRRFDVVFVYQPSPITACLPAIVVSRLWRVPLFLWTLDLWPETLQAVSVVKSPLVLRQIGRMVTFIYRRCTLVLGQSRGFESNVQHYSGDATRFRYFPQWSESLFGHGPAPAARAPETIPFAATFNVVFAGNIGDAQDFPAILDAAECLRHRRDIQWLIVGDGRAARWVRDEIARRQLDACVHLLGRHAIERMPEFFAAAGALLVTLRKDPVFSLTIPGKVQTYLASGVPLLGMLDGEGARVIDESGAGLSCPAGDAVALAACVEALAAMSPQARAEMGARGVAYSALEFDRDRLLTQLERWISDATSSLREATA